MGEMQLEHRVTVPMPVEQVWETLLDVERTAGCVPGATVESVEGDTAEGRFKVKVGPIQVTYAGTARIVEKDPDARRAVVEATGTEARGTGTASATITVVLSGSGGSTDALLTTDLQVTGRPAQFGHGVLVDVGTKLLGRFADCLASGGQAVPVGPVATAPAGAETAASGAEKAASGAETAASGAETAASGAESAAAAKDIAAATSSPEPLGTPPPPPLRRVPAGGEATEVLVDDERSTLRRLLPLLGAAALLLVLWRLLVRPRG